MLELKAADLLKTTTHNYNVATIVSLFSQQPSWRSKLQLYMGKWELGVTEPPLFHIGLLRAPIYDYNELAKNNRIKQVIFLCCHPKILNQPQSQFDEKLLHLCCKNMTANDDNE